MVGCSFVRGPQSVKRSSDVGLLRARQMIEEVAANASDMIGRGPLQQFDTGFGQLGVDDAAVRSRRNAGHVPASDKPVEAARESARGQPQAGRQITHAQLLIGRFAQIGEHLVVAKGEVVCSQVGLQVGKHQPRDLGEGAPSPHLGNVQPGGGIRHGRHFITCVGRLLCAQSNEVAGATIASAEPKGTPMSNQPAAGTWNVDPTHSSVGFSVRHLMISKVRGNFTKFSGVVVIDADPAKSTVTAEVDMASINTSDENRDNHLRAGDFFEVEKFPTMTLKSTSLNVSGAKGTLVADLTIKGVTKSVEFEVEYEGEGTDPWGNKKIGLSASAEINRKEWGMEYNAALETGGVMIGEKVRIDLDIQAVKAA